MKDKKDKANFLFTDEEIMLIKNIFADNESLQNLMRKVFLANYDNPHASIWANFSIEAFPTMEQAVVAIQAKQEIIKWIESRLLQIRILAGSKEETIEQAKERLLRDSTK